MNLTEHIKLHHNGNNTAYAKTQGVSPTQVKRWVDMECIVIDGEPWRRAKPINKKSTEE